MLANTRWNIFARVLEDILTKRHLNWQDVAEQAGIEQDTINRLQTSLVSPTTFPILTIEEMDNIFAVFDVNPHEMLQLRAALIATAVESTLMKRIESQAALLAAEQVFVATLDALVKQKDEKRGDVPFMGGGGGTERFFDVVRRCIDAGNSARQMSRFVAKEERMACIQEALYHFEQARKVLEGERRPTIRSMKLWKQYDQTIQRECELIRKELKSLRR